MPRALLGLVMLWAALAAGCDRESPPPSEEPAPRSEAEVPAPAAPDIDISGMDEAAALVALMKYEVAGDQREDQSALSRFATVDAEVLLDLPTHLLPEYLRPETVTAESGENRNNIALVEQQVPAEIRDAIRAKGRAKVLLVDYCTADVGTALGIPGDLDEGSSAQYLDEARFELAMEREGHAPIPLPADFRDMEGERESVVALNRRLFDLHRSGAARDVLVVIDLSDGCGAGEMPVKLVSDPPFQSLRILPEFYFVLCGKRTEDAWSTEQCRWWEDVAQDVVMVAGTYYYAATWPDGTETRGRFVIDEQAAAALQDGRETLTLDITQQVRP